jgi:hypothetical protein
LAPRYVYISSIPFAILAALLVADVGRQAARLSPALPLALGVAAVGVLVVYSWQTWQQHNDFDARTEQWEDIATSVKDRYPDLPPGSRVYVRGGPLTDAIWQFTVLPAYGTVLWDEGVDLFAVPAGTRELCEPEGDLFVLDYDGGRYTPVVATDSFVAVNCAAQLEP